MLSLVITAGQQGDSPQFQPVLEKNAAVGMKDGNPADQPFCHQPDDLGERGVRVHGDHVSGHHIAHTCASDQSPSQLRLRVCLLRAACRARRPG
jgi:hypothetical protein